MTYRVEWTRKAIGQLAEAWNRAADREVVTTASYEIEQTLSQFPAEGESRPDGRRILIVPPLGALFRLLSDGRTVLVEECWRFRTRNG